MFILTVFNLVIMALLVLYVFYRLVKTKGLFTLISFTMQMAAFTIVLLSLVSKVQTSSAVELFYIIFGMVVPCGLIALDYRYMIKTIKSKGNFEGLISTPKNIKVKKEAVDGTMGVLAYQDFIADTVRELGFQREEIIKGIRKKLIQAEKSYNDEDFDTAYEIYRSLTEIAGTSSNLYFYLGNISFKKGLLGEALQHFRKVLELNEENIRKAKKSKKPGAVKGENDNETMDMRYNEYTVYYNIGVTYLHMGKPELAADYFKKALTLNAGFDMAKEGIGRALEQQGNKREAFGYYEEIAGKDAGNYEIYLKLGRLAAEMGDGSKAKDCFGRCLKINADRPEGYAELGNLYLNEKEYSEAINVFKAYAALKEEDYVGHYNLAGCYYRTNAPDMAAEEYEKALALNPKSYSSAFNLGIIHEEKEELERAIECYERTILLNTDFVEAYNHLGILFSRLNRPFEALTIYAAGIKVRPDNFRLYYNMGVVLYELRKYEDSAASFKKALEIQPQDIDTFYYLGAVLTELKKYEEAMQIYSRALGENASEGELYYNLAAVNALMKKQDIAIGNLKKAVSINSGIRERVCRNNVFDYMHGNPEFVELIS